MKKDIFYPLILCLVLIIFFGLNYYSFGSFLYDCGREFLVPDIMNNGFIPIKDIFVSYFPLSYQFNALLFKIFGSNFDTLRVAGILFSLICVCFIYFSSRFFVDEKKSFMTSLIISFVSMFNISHIFNWVAGYSYAFIYAASILFVSIYFALYYLKKDKFLYPAFLTLGVCFALKLEFLPVVIPYFLLFYLKKTPYKKIIVSFLLFLLPLSLSFLFLKFSINDFISYLIFMKDFISAPLLKTYSQNVFHNSNFGDYFSGIYLSSYKFFLWLFVFFLVLYKASKNRKQTSFFVLSFILGLIFLITGIIIKPFYPIEFFGFLSFSSMIILFLSIRRKDYIFAFLCLIQIFLSLRFYFGYSSGYSAYLLPSGLFVNILFFIKSEYKVFSKILISFLIVFSISNVCYFTISNAVNKNISLKTERGTINVKTVQEKEMIQNIISFMDKIPENKEVLILPEGTMFNYISKKPTAMKYYQLIPNHIEAFGENNIVEDLRKNPPEYIIFNNTTYYIYGKTVICDSFAEKICDFTYKNYDYITTFNNKDFIMNVYRLKKSF